MNSHIVQNNGMIWDLEKDWGPCVLTRSTRAFLVESDKDKKRIKSYSKEILHYLFLNMTIWVDGNILDTRMSH